MKRKETKAKPRPAQGARLRELRMAAGLSQSELARIIAVPQPNITFWEQSDKPPRSDVLPAMARTLGVKVEDLLVDTAQSFALTTRKAGPTGKMQRAFELAAKLPRRQQDKIIEFISAFVYHYENRQG